MAQGGYKSGRNSPSNISDQKKKNYSFLKHKSSPHRHPFNSEASRGGFHCCFKCPLWVSLVNQLQQRNQKPHRENVMAANSVCLPWSLGHLLWHFSSPHNALFIVPLSFTATACRHAHQPETEVSALPSPAAAFLWGWRLMQKPSQQPSPVSYDDHAVYVRMYS